MPDYKEMYFALFNKITDAIDELERLTEELRRAQIQAEEMYIDEKEN